MHHLACRLLCLLCLCCLVLAVCGQGYVNVARGKSYSQSSKWSSSDSSSWAANGNTNNYYVHNCIHSGNNDNNPWWQVDLGRIYPVYNITIWSRNMQESRLYPANITVDSQTCASIDDFPRNSRRLEVLCHSVMYGQRVRITRHPGWRTDKYLNMCEMQIWVPADVSYCPAGRYGGRCNLKCNDHCGKGPGKNFCHRYSRQCYDGCVAGWYGDQCSTACSPGCANNQCDEQTGRCGPCTHPYTGDRCTDCQSGYYKSVTSTCYKCSNQCHLQNCHGQTGTCYGCVDHYYGSTCTLYCQTAHCQRCDQNTGVCTQCAPNSHLKPPACTGCQNGYYKSDSGGCDRCGANCQSQGCDSKTGRCLGCIDGYYGRTCNLSCQPRGCGQCEQDTGQCQSCSPNSFLMPPQCIECQDGYHDSNGGTCDRCSDKCQTQSCDKHTGNCQGCVDGRYGPKCTQFCPWNCAKCEQATGVCTQCTLNSHLKPPSCTDCIDGYFKSSGSLQCSECTWSCQSGTVCDKTTGHCPVCPPGKQGHHCDEDCDAGRYGQNCTESCGHCQLEGGAESCHPATGQCTHGCQDGWKPPLCQQECDDGSWGTDCAWTCGHCRGGAVCEKKGGQCPLCEVGWEPPLCDTECQDGRYGENCTRHCGSCVRGVVCNKSTGHCPCIKGKQPPLCDTDCLNKRYGENCAKTCGQCRGGQTCNPATGQCSKGCQPGWTDPTPSTTSPTSLSPSTLCQTECPDGSYGEGCNQTCGNCQVISECRHDTGHCTGDCADGFTGLYCAQAVKDDGGNIPTIAGAVAAAVVAIVVAVVVVMLVKRKRRRAAQSDTVSSELSNSVQYTDDRRASEGPATSSLTFDPILTNGDNTHAKPKALVKPALKPKPTNTEGHVYENVPHQKQKSAPKPTPAAPRQEGKKKEAANAPKRGSPAKEPPRPPPATESTQLAGREPLTDDEELDSRFSGEPVYANDPSYINFQPARFPLDRLRETILDSLQDDKTDAEFEAMVPLKDYPMANGKRQENHYKNRFTSILPYDKNRVVLEKVDGEDASDYVNASFIKGYKAEKAYIASQGPRSNTQDDFWRMVWQEGVTDIVMLTNVKEGNKPKCHEYWPSKGESLNTGRVELTALEEEGRANFIIRTFTLRKLQSDDKRQVRQYHYLKWMDHEVPATTPLVDFWRYVRARAPRTATAPPLLVHCSAGVGRTGTYIALDILMDQTQEEEEISLFRTVDSLREDRCHMVQNKGQYKFLHEAVVEAYLSGDCRQDTSSFDRLFPHTVHHHLPHPRLDAEFERLCQMRSGLSPPSHTVASLEENRHKNRNPEALPGDKHLVYITEHAKERNQYINAVYMPTFLSSRGSIVTQLPLADTVIDLWRLVDSWDVTTIVSIGQGDGGRGMCRYWPTDKGRPVTCGDYTISLKSMTSLGDSLSSYRMDISKQKTSREARVLHYKAWDGEVADDVPDLLTLLRTLRTSHEESTEEPIIIQCIDGVAKSGLLCVLWDVISRMTYDGEVDVYMAARHVHTVRPEAISSVEQYRFVYEVIRQFGNSGNVYVNM